MSFSIELEGAKNSGLVGDVRAAAESIIERALIRRYGSAGAVVDAYMDHWDRLNAGEARAENGEDDWSRALADATSECDPLFDGWHRVPDLVPAVRIN